MTKRGGLVTVCAILLTLANSSNAAAAPPSTQPSRTGRFRVTFTERNPLSAPEEIARRSLRRFRSESGERVLSEEEKARLAYELGDYEFDVIVPPRYKRGVPHGLFIWVGQCDIQNVWLPILARHKLIAAVPEDPRVPRDKRIAHVSKTPPDVRIGLALDAVHNLSKQYDIDKTRVYVAGFSAGGGLAAGLLRGYPEVFSGVCCFMGGEFYQCPPGADGKAEPSSAEVGLPWQCPIEQAKRDARIVLMRGEKDGARMGAAWGRADAESLRLEGFTRVTYIELPNWPHFPPTAPWFERAMAGLNAKPKPPPTTRPTTSDKPHADQLAQARRLLAGGKVELKQREQVVPGSKQPIPRLAALFERRARVHLDRLVADFPATSAADDARDILERLDAERPAATTQP